jgi:hypothetical protein
MFFFEFDGNHWNWSMAGGQGSLVCLFFHFLPVFALTGLSLCPSTEFVGTFSII